MLSLREGGEKRERERKSAEASADLMVRGPLRKLKKTVDFLGKSSYNKDIKITLTKRRKQK